MSEKLTPKHEVFVAEVLAGASATEAGGPCHLHSGNRVTKKWL